MRLMQFSIFTLLSVVALAGCAKDSPDEPMDSGADSETGISKDSGQDTGEGLVDQDGDGVSSAEDCDDTNASIFPQAGDVFGDGVDSDCDGLDCNAGWSADRSVYFAACPEGRFRDAQKTACEAAGYGGLAEVYDQSEQDLAVSLLDGSAHYYIGLNDFDDDDVFAWDSGKALEFSAWGSGEPLHDTGENCVILSSTKEQWHDVICDRSSHEGFEFGAICELR